MALNDIIAQVQTRVPAWQGKTLAVEPLHGGITNQNYKITVDDTAFVMRVCASNVGIHGINRQNEYQCAQAAGHIGIAPPLFAFFGNLPEGHDIMINHFIVGETLTSAQIGSPAYLPQITDLLQRYHGLTDFAGRFDVFQIFENGLAFAQQQNAPLPPFIDQVQEEMQRIKTALQRHPLQLAACHNDLLAANFLLDETGRIWLIDWEYAGWGDPFFDLGNLSVNNAFDDGQDAALLSRYFGAIKPSDLARLKLMKIVSDAREGIWAMVQWGISDLEFDFAAYGNRHLERFITNCAAPAVTHWLDEVQTAS